MHHDDLQQDHAVASGGSWPHDLRLRRRTEFDLAAQQLWAIDAFLVSRREAEQAAAAVSASRERRLDARRRLEALRREQAALIGRVTEQMQVCGLAPLSAPARRAVLAHRSGWFADKVEQGLVDHGIEVVARVENGADAVGVVVAEQPDVVLLEDMLPMLPGEQVLREARSFCPASVFVAQVPHADRVAALLEAGANAVVTRSMAPPDVVVTMTGLLDETVPGQLLLRTAPSPRRGR